MFGYALHGDYTVLFQMRFCYLTFLRREAVMGWVRVYY